MQYHNVLRHSDLYIPFMASIGDTKYKVNLAVLQSMTKPAFHRWHGMLQVGYGYFEHSYFLAQFTYSLVYLSCSVAYFSYVI